MRAVESDAMRRRQSFRLTEIHMKIADLWHAIRPVGACYYDYSHFELERLEDT